MGLHHADRHGGVLAILTPCTDRDLGLDVLARLAKGRVLPMDPFSAVLALFGARVLDPVPGFYQHNEVYCLDFKSLYPSIMVGFDSRCFRDG